MDLLREENKHLQAQIACLREENAVLHAELQRIMETLRQLTTGYHPHTKTTMEVYAELEAAPPKRKPGL